MSLAELLVAPADRSLCKLGVVRSGLTAEDRDALDAALADEVGFPARFIVSVLRLEGHQVGRTTVQEHRAGVCRCGA